MVCNRLANINEKACNTIPETVNKLALSAHLGHSGEDGCGLWGFIREIKSDISNVKHQFFPAGTTSTQL
jgi:hypothetical protein